LAKLAAMRRASSRVSNRQEECVEMPGKMAKSDPRPPCGLPEVPITVRTSPLSCRKAGKAPIFTSDREPSGGIPVQHEEGVVT